MGFITRVMAGSFKSAVNQIKNVDVVGPINKGLNLMGIEVPDVELPESIKNFKPNYEVKDLKLPIANISSYISPVAASLLSGVDIPSEFGGVKLPDMPDLSSVSGDIDAQLSNVGLSTETLGIRSVSDILQKPDLTALKAVQFENPVDLNNLPDLTTAMDDFDLNGIQGQIDDLKDKVPSLGSIDISKYF